MRRSPVLIIALRMVPIDAGSSRCPKYDNHFGEQRAGDGEREIVVTLSICRL